MRKCKPSDIQALEIVVDQLEQLCLELTVIRGKVNKLKTDLKQYTQGQQEPINVQTTHGLSADNG